MGGRIAAPRWVCAATIALAAQAGCGRIAFDDEPLVECASAPDAGHCYSLFTTPATWHDARAACESLGPTTHLVTIDGPRENDFAFRLAATIPNDPSQTNPNQRSRMWMGGSELETVTVWTWITGEPFDYTNWREGEPSDPGSESCLIMLGEIDGLWDDRPCDVEYEYLCERE
jgi:hypothetical protein